MIEKFKTLFFVKSSLISLYLALTIPIPFVSIDRLKIPSIVTFFLGLYLIINITSDYVETCNNKISYKTSFISKFLGKKNSEIFWKDIKLIKSLPTSQGSKVYYFNTFHFLLIKYQLFFLILKKILITKKLVLRKLIKSFLEDIKVVMGQFPVKSCLDFCQCLSTLQKFKTFIV